MPFTGGGVGPAVSIASGTSFPTNPDEGDVFYRTDQNTFYVYDGTSWVEWEIETHAGEHTPETAADPIDALTQAQMKGTEPPAQLTAYPLVHGTDTDVPASAHHAKTGDNEVIGLVLKGTAATRPAAGINGRWYIATDTLEISYDDGTAWNRVGVLGGLDLTAHAARHEPGGADPADAYLQGDSAGLWEQHGSVTKSPTSTGTITFSISFPTAFSAEPEYAETEPLDKPGGTGGLVGWGDEVFDESKPADNDCIEAGGLEWTANISATGDILYYYHAIGVP